jgi:hypothetical protein
MCKREQWMKQEKFGKTKTYTFMLPLLGFTPKWYGDSLLNCYIEAGDIIDEHKLILIFRMNPDDKLENVLHKLDSKPEYVESFIDVDELVYKFSIPDKFKIDFQHFLNGDYSKFTQLCKDVLNITYGKEHLVNAVIYPTDHVRKQICTKLGVDELPKGEVFSIVDENEYFKSRNELQLKEEIAI